VGFSVRKEYHKSGLRVGYPGILGISRSRKTKEVQSVDFAPKKVHKVHLDFPTSDAEQSESNYMKHPTPAIDSFPRLLGEVEPTYYCGDKAGILSDE
jgi:hypothetical protein